MSRKKKKSAVVSPQPLLSAQEEDWETALGDDGFFLPLNKWSGNSAAFDKWFKKCEHKAEEPVKIAGHDVWFGACSHIDEETVEQFDLILPLNGSMPYAYFGRFLPIVACELVDRGGVPKGWASFVRSVVYQIEKGSKVLAYCTGGHGRTGTMGASLIALMEPDTLDPIAAMRERHCNSAVETLAQAEAIFALKGQTVPEQYLEEFKPVVFLPKKVVDPLKQVTTFAKSAVKQTAKPLTTNTAVKQ